jgi:ubiquitin conjugation factor E4 B
MRPTPARGAALAPRAASATLLGAFQAPLALLSALAASPPLARTLVRHPAWCPGGAAGSAARAPRAGRTLERTSLLGPFLAVSALPDVFDGGAAPPVEELFASQRRGDVAAAQATLRALALQLQEGVYGIVMALLRHKDPSREGVVAFLARMVNANAERGKMQINPEACASHGA